MLSAQSDRAVRLELFHQPSNASNSLGGNAALICRRAAAFSHLTKSRDCHMSSQHG
jgi:hypothetical protein